MAVPITEQAIIGQQEGKLWLLPRILRILLQLRRGHDLASQLVMENPTDEERMHPSKRHLMANKTNPIGSSKRSTHSLDWLENGSSSDLTSSADNCVD